MQQYLDLLKHVLENGEIKTDRTGTGTISVFGTQTRYDLKKGFPLVTTKKVSFRLVLAELLWFLKGSTNIKWLQDQNCHIWDEWADKDGNLGPVYGKQWRSWEKPTDYTDFFVPIFKSVDQILNLIEGIRNNPDSRRHIVSAWNVGEIDKMALPPCHLLFQFYVNNKKQLSCQLYQRSADLFLGVPFNIASYALLTTMIASVTDLEVGEFVHTIGDAHIYLNHIDQVKLQLTRQPLELPKLQITKETKNIFDFDMNDFVLQDYNSHSVIKGDVSV